MSYEIKWNCKVTECPPDTPVWLTVQEVLGKERLPMRIIVGIRNVVPEARYEDYEFPLTNQEDCPEVFNVLAWAWIQEPNYPQRAMLKAKGVDFD